MPGRKFNAAFLSHSRLPLRAHSLGARRAKWLTRTSALAFLSRLVFAFQAARRTLYSGLGLRVASSLGAVRRLPKGSGPFACARRARQIEKGPDLFPGIGLRKASALGGASHVQGQMGGCDVFAFAGVEAARDSASSTKSAHVCRSNPPRGCAKYRPVSDGRASRLGAAPPLALPPFRASATRISWGVLLSSA